MSIHEHYLIYLYRIGQKYTPLYISPRELTFDLFFSFPFAFAFALSSVFGYAGGIHIHLNAFDVWTALHWDFVIANFGWISRSFVPQTIVQHGQLVVATRELGNILLNRSNDQKLFWQHTANQSHRRCQQKTTPKLTVIKTFQHTWATMQIQGNLVFSALMGTHTHTYTLHAVTQGTRWIEIETKQNKKVYAAYLAPYRTKLSSEFFRLEKKWILKKSQKTIFQTDKANSQYDQSRDTY